MQSDYAWLEAVRSFPVKPAEAQSSADVYATEAGLPSAWGASASPAQFEQHGSESESLTAHGHAAFQDTSAPEVDSATGAGDGQSPVSPAAWPFLERKRPGTPVLHPVPR